METTLFEEFLNQINFDELARKFEKEFSIKVPKSYLKESFEKAVSVPKREFGDLSLNLFVIISSLAKKGVEISNKDMDKLLSLINPSLDLSKEFIKKVEIVKPYLNIFIQENKLLEMIFHNFSSGINLKGEGNANQKILVEHTSINPSGPVNVARIRNSFIGDTIVRVYKKLGFNVRVHYYVNDMGKQVAILTAAKERGVKEDEELKSRFKKYADRPDFKTFFVYVPANKLYAEDESFKKEVELILQKCELGDKRYLSKVKETAEFCLKGQVKSLERLGITFDHFDYESRFLESGDVKRIISKLKSLEEHSVVEGNHVLNLEKYGFKSRFGGVVFERANGTSVYITRDIAYHIYKKKLADKLITILGEDHKVEFKLLKQILKILKVIKDDSELEVVHFAFVSMNGEKFSTRRGVVVPVDEVLDEGVEKVLSILKEREVNFSKDKQIEIAEAVATSAIRYFELKVAPSKQINFDWDSALSFEGQTGPYIQYALVRAKKILLKSGIKDELSLDISRKEEAPFSDEERELMKKILSFKEAVYETARKKSPSILANYAYELANIFSKFYENNPVISEDKNLMNRRIVIITSFMNVLKECMFMLGIKEIEEM